MRQKCGFSLIELLMVLGVMSILMGMLVPAVGVVRGKAQRMATAQKLRQIGIAVATYHSVTGRSLSGSDLGDWIARLGKETGIREGELYIFEEDPLLAQVARDIPPVLVAPSGGGAWVPIDGFEDWPVGVTVVSGLSPLASPSTTPVAWTRGLTLAGQWAGFDSARSGVYGNEGGYIVFLDGHVEFYRDLAEDGGQLVHYQNGGLTSNIADAVSPGCHAYDFLGKVF